MSTQPQAPLKIILSKPVGTFAAIGGGLVSTISLLGLVLAYFVASTLLEGLSYGGVETEGREFGISLLVGLGTVVLLGFGAIGLGECLTGVRRLLRPEIEVPGPKPFRDYQGEVTPALTEGKLVVYGSLSSRLRLLFGKNIVSLPPVAHKIVAQNGNSIFRRLFTIPFLVLIVAIMAIQDAKVALMLPFVILIAAGAVQTVIEYVFSRSLVPERPTVANANHASRHYKGFGHPTHLFARLPVSASSLALRGYPNRVYQWGESEKAGVVRDTGEFSATIFIEQHPQLLETESSTAGRLLLASGWAWRVLSGTLLLFIFTPPGIWVTDSGLGTTLFILATLRFFYKGSVYKRQGVTLLDSLRFSSVGSLLNIKGEISRANVRVGANTSDSVASESLATRSDFTVQLSAAKLLSETVAGDEPRHLLEVRTSSESEEWTREIQEGIETLREERVRMIGVETGSSEFTEMAEANRQLLAERAALLGMQEKPVVVRSDPPAISKRPEPSVAGSHNDNLDGNRSDLKYCPDCAERIQRAARKCRFCGFRFKEMMPEPRIE